jgi:hypothetical protein
MLEHGGERCGQELLRLGAERGDAREPETEPAGHGGAQDAEDEGVSQLYEDTAPAFFVDIAPSNTHCLSAPPMLALAGMTLRIVPHTTGKATMIFGRSAGRSSGRMRTSTDASVQQSRQRT